MTTATPNGRPQRKQLGDQLDRLDSILDGLADALNEAVADAAREGARAAVKEILTELLTNPQLAGLLRQATPPAASDAKAPAPKPSRWAKLRAATAAVANAAKTAAENVVAKGKAVVKPVIAVLDVLRLAGGLKKALWVAASAGVVVGAVSAACPHWLSAAVSAGAGAVTAVAVQVGLAVRGFVAKFRMA